jgi:quercetin dioxygenase-like cupin family protein
LLEQISIPEDGTISRTIYQDEQIKAVLFGFATGQELSEHTSATPAIMHFVQGEARVTLGYICQPTYHTAFWHVLQW